VPPLSHPPTDIHRRQVLRATLSRTEIDAAAVEDVTVGNVLPELGGAKAGRMALIHAGFPYTTAFNTVNRQCSSGLQAVTNVAQQIRTGMLQVGIAGGVESMTRNYGSRAIPVDLSPELRNSHSQDALDCIMVSARPPSRGGGGAAEGSVGLTAGQTQQPMGLTSENVALRYGVSREDQDRFAAESHRKAAAAQAAGLFDAEIVPMETRWIDGDGRETRVLVAHDDGVRPTATPESLAKLKPAFRADGSSTAGNSAQVSDGAAAALMMRRDVAETLGCAPVAKFVATAVAGVKPDEMGVGPAAAIPRVLDMAGIAVADVGIWELNEAFASQAIYCVRTLGLPPDRVNPKGGAIAIGHPLGATGTRQLAALLPELQRQDEKVGVISMCIGTGSGLAAIVVRE